MSNSSARGSNTVKNNHVSTMYRMQSIAEFVNKHPVVLKKSCLHRWSADVELLQHVGANQHRCTQCYCDNQNPITQNPGKRLLWGGFHNGVGGFHEAHTLLQKVGYLLVVQAGETTTLVTAHQNCYFKLIGGGGPIWPRQCRCSISDGLLKCCIGVN